MATVKKASRTTKSTAKKKVAKAPARAAVQSKKVVSKAKAPVRSKQAVDTTTPAIIEGGALILSLMFVYSVAQNAQAFMDTSVRNAPSSYALICAAGMIAYAWYLRKKFSLASIIAIGVIGASGLFWIFGIN